jgi:predicted lipid-binding transport protein (Tim44 family)
MRRNPKRLDLARPHLGRPPLRRRSHFLLALVAALALLLTPGLADARAGSGSSFGSRGSQTWSSPPSTGTAGSTQSMQRSLTPGSSSYGSGSYGGYRSGFGSGLLGGLLGFGLAGLLLGHGFGGFGMFGLFGMLIRIAIIVALVRWLMRMFRGPSPYFAGGGPAMFAPGGMMGGPVGGGMGAPGPMAGPRRGLVPIAITPADYQAFEQLLVAIQAGWSAHDLNHLSALLTPEMLSYFSEQLAGQASRGVRNAVTDVRLVQGDLAEAWAEGGRHYATVAMRFQMIDATYDQAGRVVDGSPTEHVTATEVWTFVRVPGGRWILSAIQQAR